MKKRGLDIRLLDNVIDMLRQGQTLDIGYRECHIKPDWLLIYYIENDILTLTLSDTGSHSDLF